MSDTTLPARARSGPGPAWLTVGVLVRDARTGASGVVRSVGLTVCGREYGKPGEVWLRPEGGGREWTARADDLSPVR